MEKRFLERFKFKEHSLAWTTLIFIFTAVFNRTEQKLKESIFSAQFGGARSPVSGGR